MRFDTTLFDPGFLKEESLKTMFTPQKTMAGTPIEYGIGWFIHKSHSGQLTYHRSEGSIGGTSQLILYPETHIVIALVTNLSGGTWKREEVEAVAEKFAAQK